MRREPLETRFWRRVNKGIPNDCWEWKGPRTWDGYGRIGARDSTIKTHRASWLIHHGPIPPALCVLHSCDNPSCVNPSHLRLGSQSDNIEDKLSRKRHYSTRSLTASDADIARRLHLVEGLPMSQVAKQFGVHYITIYRIIRGLTYQR